MVSQDDNRGREPVALSEQELNVARAAAEAGRGVVSPAALRRAVKLLDLPPTGGARLRTDDTGA